MDLNFHTSSEIIQILSSRLRTERLAQKLTQSELAQRAGVGVNTVSNMEAGRNVSLDAVVRIAMILGRDGELKELFKPKLETLHDLQRYEDSVTRQRIRKGKNDVG